MDFSFSEDQETVGKVARQLFEHRATPERLTELESGEARYDAALWRELASSDLLGIALPESVGGSGGGFLELGVILSEVGRSVAPAPVYPTLVLGADTIARHGGSELQQRYLPGVIDGSVILTAGLAEAGNSDPASPRSTTARRDGDGDGWLIDGAKELVPSAQLADAIVVSALTDDGPGLFVVDTDASGVDVRPVATTHGEPYADVSLRGAPAQRLTGDGDIVGGLYIRALIGLCAIQVGVTERALRIAASYTGEREQFGRPIGSFQAVQQRMADAFIDTEAIRWTTWHAAWLIAEGRPAAREAAIAKFWAAEAGARVVATAQQVHGGMGIDVTYPVSRYYLWAKNIELALGSASQQLARLGTAYSKGN